MTDEVVAQIAEEVERLQATGKIPPGLEDELDTLFDDAAEASLAEPGNPGAGDAASVGGPGRPLTLVRLGKRATVVARQRLGPPLRRLESRTVLGTARAGESLSTQAHVTADRVERLVASSRLASRALTAARLGEPPAASGMETQPVIEEPLLTWVLDRLGCAEDDGLSEGPLLVLHLECGDGRLMEELIARGHDARGADPRLSGRAVGDTTVVSAGALEYLGATPSATLDAVLLTGVVDRLRPGAARALAHLVSLRLVPGGVVVLVSSRPEALAAIDPVAADLSPRRPVHPVTWCHLFARYGLSELTVFEPEATDTDIFAVYARRPAKASVAGEDRR